MRGAGSGLPPAAGQPSACFTTTTSRHGHCERGSRVRAESVFAPVPGRGSQAGHVPGPRFDPHHNPVIRSRRGDAGCTGRPLISGRPFPARQPPRRGPTSQCHEPQPPRQSRSPSPRRPPPRNRTRPRRSAPAPRPRREATKSPPSAHARQSLRAMMTRALRRSRPASPPPRRHPRRSSSNPDPPPPRHLPNPLHRVRPCRRGLLPRTAAPRQHLSPIKVVAAGGAPSISTISSASGPVRKTAARTAARASSTTTTAAHVPSTTRIPRTPTARARP